MSEHWDYGIIYCEVCGHPNDPDASTCINCDHDPTLSPDEEGEVS